MTNCHRCHLRAKRKSVFLLLNGSPSIPLSSQLALSDSGDTRGTLLACFPRGAGQ